ncbi:MAG: transposase [bacterium]|nr:transposase [bacterium]
MSIPKTPNIPDEKLTPHVAALLEIIQLQQEQIQALKDEIAILKKQNPRPKIKPSKLEKDIDKEKGKKKRPGSARKKKRGQLDIHETKVVKPENVPSGSRFKGYENYTVQGLIIKPHNILYRRERWKTPQGEYIVAPLPDGMQVLGGHFDPTLVAYILHQYNHAQVTQPLIWEQLDDLGIQISTGQVSRIITENKDQFHAEKDDILTAGLEVSKYVQVDDTGARHQGKNGYCTHIGNDLFAWFKSTDSKSRVNFLELLRAGGKDYIINEDALEYMKAGGLPATPLKRLAAEQKQVFEDEKQWLAAVESWAITNSRHIRIATEGALLGSIMEHGFNPELAILSDDAGQFNVILHALCWVHAERSIKKLVGFTHEQRTALEQTRGEIWDFYQMLKGYKIAPSEPKKFECEKRFDEIFAQQTCFATLNQALKRLHKNKNELLLVLTHPDIPLHNNLSESDIREYVKKRKISGSTRSANGRRCRDTFASLKKTCRKHSLSFWNFLLDRLTGRNKIPPLPELIRQRAAQSHQT